MSTEIEIYDKKIIVVELGNHTNPSFVQDNSMHMRYRQTPQAQQDAHSAFDSVSMAGGVASSCSELTMQIFCKFYRTI